MSLDANDLILFAHIMEAGSFSKAAERTGLPKSTLSRRITALETKLGERLLTRSTRRLAITEFGERILDHAKRLLEETEAASAMALHRQGTPRGVLRVSMPPDFRELDLTPLLLQYAASYPEVRLELDLSPRRVDLLAERFDLAVRAASRLPDDGTLVARKLCEMTNGLYASPAYLKRYGIPASPPDLLDHVGLRLIGGNGEAQPWRLARGTETWEGLPNGPLAVNSPACSATSRRTAWASSRSTSVLPKKCWNRACFSAYCPNGACRPSPSGASPRAAACCRRGLPLLSRCCGRRCPGGSEWDVANTRGRNWAASLFSPA